MIRLNASLEGHAEKTHRHARTREFTGILTALRPFWDQYLADPEAHTARGMLGTRKGRAYAADLSVDEGHKRIRLVVRLPVPGPLDTARMFALLHLQHRSDGLASVTFDAESRVLQIVSRSVLPAASAAQEVIPRIVADALRILEDEAIKHLTH
jgi:hypothetical protein